MGGGASNEVIGTAYYAYDFFLAAEMAAAIGENKDAAEYRQRADQVADGFAKTFIGAGGRMKDSSQTAYALAFSMGLVPADLQDRVTDRFVEEIGRFHWHLATGFIGTPRLLPALHAAGRDDIAYHLLLQESYPSWLYPVKLGATTIWERWDGWTPEHGFQDSGMNSFNHYALGAVGQYLYAVVGGIQAETPGFRRIRIQPVLPRPVQTISTAQPEEVPSLSFVRASYNSIHGLIACEWKRDGPSLSLDVSIPANTTAAVYVPAGSPEAVTESGKPALHADEVTFLRMEGSAAVFSVGSGNYRFRVH